MCTDNLLYIFSFALQTAIEAVALHAGHYNFFDIKNPGKFFYKHVLCYNTFSADDYMTLTTPLMEAMVLVGLSFGPFTNGASHKLSMDIFIKYSNELVPIVKKRRNDVHATLEYYLKEQRKSLFATWQVFQAIVSTIHAIYFIAGC